ncbi:hypothetical protein JTE90_014289 [Oedothorax gibbosus]|uniref:Uncharacterized protein n=1 Tax=Oedothorax gibbosus TaxID=931172 RepID=A0AAV6TS68_9ARAC|nr:hypothetical protein JTE90_014289 [Oedothorax gibbosus]
MSDISWPFASNFWELYVIPINFNNLRRSSIGFVLFCLFRWPGRSCGGGLSAKEEVTRLHLNDFMIPLYLIYDLYHEVLNLGAGKCLPREIVDSTEI